MLDGVWVVGGWLRDGWLGRHTVDIDLAVVGDLDGVLARLAKLYGCQPFELGLRHGSFRLVSSGAMIDISPLYREDISADLARRDYTVNAMALPASRLGSSIGEKELEAHPQAVEDLEGRVLRMVSARNIEEDPLRVMRGYRLCAELGFTPEQDTRDAWRDLAATVTTSAPERIHEELLRLLRIPGPVVRYLGWLAEDSVLWALMPELQAMAGCEQNAYHHLDVWTHTLEALESLDGLNGDYPPELEKFAEELDAALAAPESGMATGLALLRLALLLHDVDKPTTRDVQHDGRITFYQHQELGSNTARELLGRLKFSTDEQDLVCVLVLEHLRLGFYSDQLPLPPKLIYRYIRRLGSATPLAVLHALADCLATRGPLNEGGFEKHVAAAATILKHFLAADTIAAPPTLLDGNQIMELLGIEPGPLVGELKEALAESTASGEVADEAQARRFIEEHYRQLSANG